MSKKEKNTEEEKATQDHVVSENTKENSEQNNVEKNADQAATAKKSKGCDELLKKESEKYLRLFAEFENYKRRTSKERIELFKTAGVEVLTALLPVLDDFQRAMVEIKKSEDKELIKGVVLIQEKLTKTLNEKGLEKVEVAVGDTFDADSHEAITQIPAPSEDLKGKVIDITEQGYKIGEKIIRYPKVVIGQS